MKRAALALAVMASVALIAMADWRLAQLLPHRRLDFALYLVAHAFVSIDLIDLLARSYFRRTHTSASDPTRVAPASIPLDVGRFSPYQVRLHLRPYAIAVSVHNLADELDDFLDRIAPYRDRVWVIDDASTDDTAARLERAGLRCLRGSPNRNKPGALRALLQHIPDDVKTIVVIDPDARILDSREGGISDLERVLFEFQRSRMAALCPRLSVRRDGWLARFQELEYGLTFSLGRKSMADHTVTSGIAVYRRDALEQVLAEHTLSIYAEDLKNAILLLARGERIYYDGRLHIETEGKRTVPGWFSQRVGWHYGLLKVYTEHLREMLRVAGRRPIYIYQFLVYLGVFTIVLHPLKLAAVALLSLGAANGLDNALALGIVPDGRLTEPVYFVLVYAKFLVVISLGLWLTRPRGTRLELAHLIPLYFFYAIAHLIPITVGYLNWLLLSLTGRRLYRDHYERDDRLHDEKRRRAG